MQKQNGKRNRKNLKTNFPESLEFPPERRFFHLIGFENGIFPDPEFSKSKEMRDKIIVAFKNALLTNTEFTTVEVIAHAGIFIDGVPCLECVNFLTKPIGPNTYTRCEKCVLNIPDLTFWNLAVLARKEWLKSIKTGMEFTTVVNDYLLTSKDDSGTYITAAENKNSEDLQPSVKKWTLWPFF